MLEPGILTPTICCTPDASWARQLFAECLPVGPNLSGLMLGIRLLLVLLSAVGESFTMSYDSWGARVCCSHLSFQKVREGRHIPGKQMVLACWMRLEGCMLTIFLFLSVIRRSGAVAYRYKYICMPSCKRRNVFASLLMKRRRFTGLLRGSPARSYYRVWRRCHRTCHRAKGWAGAAMVRQNSV